MRLITRRRIYRAFPELDRFTDEQCERLYAAVRRNAAAALARMILVCVTTVGGIILAGTVVGILFGGVRGPRSDVAYRLSTAALFAVVLLAGGLAGLLTHDVLLRDRFRFVLRARARCASCGYSLLGLPVSPACTVLCPECAHESEVDESLGELATTSDGKHWFRPGED